LRNKKGLHTFEDIVKALPLASDIKGIIKDNFLYAEVDAEQYLVTLNFAETESLDLQTTEFLLKPLSQLLGGKTRVAIKQKKITAEPELRQKWELILNCLGQNFPFLQGSLGDLKHKLFRDKFCLVVPTPFLAQMLEQKRRVLEDLICHELGKKLRIEIAAGNGASDQQWLQMKEKREEQEQKIIAQLRQTEEKKVSQSSSQNSYAVIIGKEISGPTATISELSAHTEEKSVLEGYVIDWETKEIKGGKVLFQFTLTDRKDSILVKTFTDSQKAKELELACHRDDIWLRVKGAVEVDRFSNELVVNAGEVSTIPARWRNEDETLAKKRVELHLHTQMSALDATVRLDELFSTIKRWGHQAVAVTDHGVVQAFPEAYKLGKKYGIKVIYGLEGYLIDQDKEKIKPYHVVILAKNKRGLQDLYKLVSSSHLNHFHRVPRIPREELIAYRANLIIGSACEAGELIQGYLRGLRGEELAQIASFYDYLEIQPLANNEFLLREGKVTKEQLLEMNHTIYQLGKKLDLPVVATGDVHFLEPEDACLRQILLAGQGFDDADFQPPLYLKTTSEMLAEFSYLGAEAAQEVVVENPHHIVAAIAAEIKPIPDGLHVPQIQGADKKIKEMSYQEAKRLYGDPLPDIVAQRLARELDAIIDNGFAVIYFIAHKLVKRSLADGYLVGSRGSVGSSLVATMCKITEVNPLPPHYRCPFCLYTEFITKGTVGCGFDLPERKCPTCGHDLIKDGHNIPFEVFLGFEGDKVPDIDLNFSGEYQPIIHQYTEELFGSECVYRAGTISTIADRTAYGFVKGFLTGKGLERRNAEIGRLVKGCTGTKRTTGQHPGGLIILPAERDISEFTPIQYPADAKDAGVITTHFDYHSISSRLLKLDLLGHDDPTALRMLSELTGVDPKHIPFNDPDTMAIFSGLGKLGFDPSLFDIPIGTVGIPEFGTRFVRQMLLDTQPTTFAELVRISGLSHGTDVWLNNAQDLVKSKIAVLTEVISTRDDIMTYLLERGVPAKYAFSIMERVRKGNGLRAEDIELMEKQHIPQWYIESCQKIKYMFPKAHAVAYVMMAFRIAYFKVHYPEAFYATYFSVRAGDLDLSLVNDGVEGIRRQIAEIERKGMAASPKEKSMLSMLEVALEMYARGFRFCKVSLEHSASSRFLLTPDGLLPPFQALPGIGQTAAKNIVTAREEAPFTSVEDLRIRAKLSSKVITVLKEHGCLHRLPETDQLALFAELA
jgi:DNA polymerase-3 subunit alpha (Gram-positive type)